MIQPGEVITLNPNAKLIASIKQALKRTHSAVVLTCNSDAHYHTTNLAVEADRLHDLVVKLIDSWPRERE